MSGFGWNDYVPPPASPVERTKPSAVAVGRAKQQRNQRHTFKTRLLVATIVALATAAGVFAYFTNSGTGNKAAAAAVGNLNPPTNVQATATPGSGTVPVTWTASSTVGGVTPDGYYVLRYSGGTPSAACGTSPTSLNTGASCNDTLVPDGTYTYTVVAKFNSWKAESTHSNPVTVVNDNSAPTSTLTFPGAGPYRAATWNAGCNTSPFNTSGAICGTASDPGLNQSGVKWVKVSIQATDGPSANMYWDGNSFADLGENKFLASGTTNWLLPFAASNLADGNYSVRVYATDNADKTATDRDLAELHVRQHRPTRRCLAGRRAG